MTIPGIPIICIDHNKEDILFLERLLQRVGVQPPLVAFHSAEQAMTWLDTRPDTADGELPYAVFLDVGIPSHRGFDMLKWMRRRKVFADTAVIVLSNSDDRLHIERAYGLGAQCYLIKHPSAAELAKVIEDARLFARNPANRSALFSGCFNRIMARDAATRTLTPTGVRP